LCFGASGLRFDVFLVFPNALNQSSGEEILSLMRT